MNQGRVDVLLGLQWVMREKVRLWMCLLQDTT